VRATAERLAAALAECAAARGAAARVVGSLARARPERDLECKAIALQETAGRGYHEYMSKPRHTVVAVERALGHVRRTAIEVR